MVPPEYRSIKNTEIKEILFDRGYIRLLAGSYKEHTGFKSKYLPLNYYDITLNAGAEITIETEHDDSVILFTLLPDAVISGQTVKEKTAVKLTEGNSVTIKTGTDMAKVLFIGSKTLNESIAWGCPIVMNTKEELQKAFSDLHNGTFIDK